MIFIFYFMLMLIVYLVSNVIALWNETVGSSFFYILFFILWFDYAFIELLYKTILLPLKQLV